MVFSQKIILTAFIFLFCRGFITQVLCSYLCNFQKYVHINTLKSPLLVTPNIVVKGLGELVSVNTLSYLYPVHNLCFLLNKEIGPVARVVCPGSFLINSDTGKKYHFRDQNHTSSIHLIYNDRIGLEYYENSDYSDVRLSCAKEIHPIMKKFEHYYEVGYQLDLLDFLPTLKIFFNVFDNIKVLASAKIKYIVHARSDALDIWTNHFNYNYQGPYFEEKNVNATLVYSKENQYIELQKLIFKEELITHYITENNYFVKGQLISAQDLFYVGEQKCTLFLENVVPMWKSINEGNWKRVGKIIRDLAEDTKSDFQIYAGTLGDLVIDNSVINIGNTYAPGDIIVPKILFKVAFDASNSGHYRGIAFVTINDPHISLTQTEVYSSSQSKYIYLDLPPKDYIKCWDIIECHQSYAEFTNAYEGYTYCCALESFHFWTDLKQHFYTYDNSLK